MYLVSFDTGKSKLYKILVEIVCQRLKANIRHIIEKLPKKSINGDYVIVFN